MTGPARVYLAGPEVFLPEPMVAAEAKKAICAAHGLDGIFPLDNVIDLEGLAPPAAGLRIYEANRSLMDSCDVIVANLTPFRGPSADVGTVFELGYMRGLGRPVYGYSNSATVFATRTRDWLGRPEALRDDDGLTVEDFGLSDNLMIDGALCEYLDAGFTHDPPAERRFTDLTAFERCVEAAAADLARRAG